MLLSLSLFTPLYILTLILPVMSFSSEKLDLGVEVTGIRGVFLVIIDFLSSLLSDDIM